MTTNVGSKNLLGVTELTIVADIKPGFVDYVLTMSYATRLGLLLRTLFEIRQRGIERAAGGGIDGPLERLGVLHFVQWSIIDSGRKLLLAVTFDGPWKPYMRTICETAGPILDVILCHCEGYEGHASEDGFDAFSRWARAHQLESQFFFAASPGTTSLDVAYLKDFHASASGVSPEASVSRRAAATDDASAGGASPADRMRVLTALHRLTPYFADEASSRYLLRTAHMIVGVDETRLPGPATTAALAWYATLRPRAEPERAIVQVTDPDDPQAGILLAAAPLPYGCLVLLRLDTRRREAMRRFLCDLDLTTDGAPDPEVTVNAAFTYAGLRAAGVPDEILSELPEELREGMEARAGWLGDLGCNHPSQWSPPTSEVDGRPLDLSTVDLVVQLQTARPPACGSRAVYRWGPTHPLYRDVERLVAGGGVKLLAVEPLYRELVDGEPRGHFGFRDGLSQPRVQAPLDQDFVPLGELLLGYPNDREDPPEVHPLLHNGTFLVVRKLSQDVEGLREVKASYAAAGGCPAELMQKMVGRDADGNVAGGIAASANDFDFSDDPDGARCPLDSHIRRSNPRTGRPVRDRAGTRATRIPRILRRGFSYGPPASAADACEADDRGLMFMAYNTSIADQFEVIQRWISGGNVTGELSAHGDPLMAIRAPGQRRIFRFVDRAGEQRAVDLGEKPFVTLRYGLYLFAPSRSGLRLIAEHAARPARPSADVASGAEVLAQLELVRALRGEDVAIQEWKRVLEDVALLDVTRSVWETIRARGGALRTPYGVLVGKADQVREVFSDDATYSVREYWDRMSRSIGPLSLGMDPCPRPIEGGSTHDRALDRDFREDVHPGRYAEESRVAGPWVSALDEKIGFEAAQRVTTSLLPLLARGEPRLLDVRTLAGSVLSRLATHWFGLPDVRPEDYTLIGRYIFSPRPSEFVSRAAQERGAEVLAAAKLHVDDVKAKIADGPPQNLLEHLLLAELPHADVARMVVGYVHGFMATTFGNLANSLDRWIESSALLRLQQDLAWAREDAGLCARGGTASYAVARAALMRPLEDAIQADPVPNMLHRTAVAPGTIGGFAIRPGDRIVLGITSAAAERSGSAVLDVVFGGRLGGAQRHACPGRRVATGVMLGFTTALLEAGALRRDSRLSLEIG